MNIKCKNGYFSCFYTGVDTPDPLRLIWYGNVPNDYINRQKDSGLPNLPVNNPWAIPGYFDGFRFEGLKSKLNRH